MSIVEDYFYDTAQSARTATVAAQDDDPEQAARAIELADATGVPATAIHVDLDGFEKQNKAAMSAGIISENQHIASYLASNPMAPRVSHDDLGQMDLASHAIGKFHWPKLSDVLKGMSKPPEEFQHLFETRPQDVDFALAHPAAYSVGKGIHDLIGIPLTTMSYAFRQVTEGLEKAGVPRDFIAMLEYEATKGEGGTGLVAAAHEADVGGALSTMAPYLRAEKDAPTGVHPSIDEVKKAQAKSDGEVLKDALSESVKSATRERAPDLYGDFVRGQVGDRTIGISADAIRELYGEKTPEVGDNVLGWVPNLDSALRSAELTDGEVRVPLADWLAKVDPDVAKQLHDHVRVRDGGLTIDEAKGIQPKDAIAAPESLIRGEAGFEPLFSAGDRKIKLERMAKGEPPAKGFEGFHDFDLLDETGKSIGSVNLSEQAGGKQLYVEMIQAGPKEKKFYDPNFLGPRLVLDLARQIAEEFPNAETLTGHRVSGARERAGVEMTAPMPVIDLTRLRKFRDLAEQGWDQVEPMRELLRGMWEQRGPSLEVLKPAKQSLDYQMLTRAIEEEARRIIPQQLGGVETVAGMRYTDRPGAPAGMYQRFLDKLPQVLVALDREPGEAIGILRHEAIHHLRRYGFFDQPEWSTLTRAARTEGWVKQFGIEERYARLDMPGKLEEAVAEGYRVWKAGQEMKPEVAKIFQKLKDFFDAVKTKFKELTGQELNWEEIFKKVDKGEIGAREGREPLTEGGRQPYFERAAEAGVGKFEPLAAEGEGFGLYDKGKALGVTEAHMQRMQRLIEKRNAEDRTAAERRAEVRKRREANKEWKARRTDLRDEVREQLEARPDLATDELMSKGTVKLHPDSLTPEQKAALPKEYIQKKNGIPPDELAPYFGYTSGDALVERLGLLTQERRSAGMSAKEYFNRLVDIETDRRLNAEFGDIDKRVMEDAKDQALSETQLDLVHEETLAYALKANQEPKFTKEQTRDMVKQDFDTRPVGTLSSDRLLQQAGNIGRKIEEAGAKGDWAEAYRLSQRRNHTVIAAKMARAYEKQRASLDRTFKQTSNRQVPSIEQEWLNWVHDLMFRIGQPVKRSVQDLAENIGRQSEQTLRDFRDAKEAEWMGMREVPIDEMLLDPAFRKPVDELTHAEFMGLKSSIDVLVKAGKDVKKIYREGEAADREVVLGEMRAKLATFPLREYPATKGAVQKALDLPRMFMAGMTNIETLLNRWDRADPQGIFNRYIAYPLAEASNRKNVLERETAHALEKLGRVKGRDKLVDAPFVDPLSRTEANPEGTQWTGFTRNNVMAMLQNAGNKSNWNVLARGYGADPDALMQWLFRNTTKEDWDRAQKMGDIYKGLAKISDNVYERMTGATFEKVQIEPIQTPHGEYAGWYHPLIRDPLRQEVWSQNEAGLWERKATGPKKSVLDDPDNFHASTANGYTKKRTGAIYPLDLNFDAVPARLKQIIHDVSFRETIHEVEKIFGNKSFQAEVTKHYGDVYTDLLMPYLRNMAGAEGIASRAQSKAAQVSEFLRQNVISTYIGFNPFTALKHGPTAWVMSMREVGGTNFLSAVKSLYGQSPELGLSNSEFAMKWSEELQRRERHWQDTIMGEHASLEGSANVRERIIEKGSWLVAQSDMLSAKPTWVAAYNKYIGDGLSHGESISLADRAVRRAHGSTSATNQPSLVRGGGPLHGWLTSVYGFFGTAMQRRIEIAHQLNDAYRLGKEGEIKQAAKQVPSILGDVFTYVIWPTIVEEWVTGLTTDDRRGWGTHLAAGAFMGLSSSVLYLRDIAHAAVTGHDPGVGLMSSALHDVNNVLRDFKRGREAMNKQHAGKTVGDTLTVLGEATGMVPKTIANATRFGIDLVNKQAHPRSPTETVRGVLRGTTKLREEK